MAYAALDVRVARDYEIGDVYLGEVNLHADFMADFNIVARVMVDELIDNLVKSAMIVRIVNANKEENKQTRWDLVTRFYVNVEKSASPQRLRPLARSRNIRRHGVRWVSSERIGSRRAVVESQRRFEIDRCRKERVISQRGDRSDGERSSRGMPLGRFKSCAGLPLVAIRLQVQGRTHAPRSPIGRRGGAVI